MSAYAARMARLSARIFGEVARPISDRSQRIVRLLSERPWDLRHSQMDYYPPHKEWTRLMFRLRDYGLYRDEHHDFREEMRRLRTLRGKGPPKRGAGKQAALRDV